jgi:hypothetical protein
MKTPLSKSYLLTMNALVVLISTSGLFFGCGGDDDAKPTEVEIVSMTPASPASLKYYETATNDRVSITFNYVVVEPDGVRIFIQPVSTAGGQGTIHYTPSPVFKGTGSKTVTVSVESNQVSVLIDRIKILIKSADQTAVISEKFVDVSFTFSD